MNKQTKIEIKETKNFVDKKELNLWKRGSTPQAEIWNGRMATVGPVARTMALYIPATCHERPASQ